MTTDEAKDLLDQFKNGKIPPESVLRRFQAAPFEELDFAKVDTHRSLRKGFPEVIFGEGKTPIQVSLIASRILKSETRLLITRVTQ